MTAIKISVCIPAYNRALLLPDLLDSIFKQDYKFFEVVIAEDNSPERLTIASIVIKYKNKYPNKIIYHENKKNLGYDGNLRQLIKLAHGEYVMFMGNDDLMAAGAILEIARALETYPNIGVILRSYASFLTSPENIVQVFRYFEEDAFFPPGSRTITTFFRRCVFISGMVIHRKCALAIDTELFDGTLLYQQYLIGEILAKESGVYLKKILSYHRLGGVPDFGNSDTEKGTFIPRDQTAESSLHFIRGMLKIAKTIEETTELSVYKSIMRDISNYSYPILSIQAKGDRSAFVRYAIKLARLGFWRAPLFHVYTWSLLLFGVNACDKVIAYIKLRLGRTPNLGSVYKGQL